MPRLPFPLPRLPRFVEACLWPLLIALVLAIAAPLSAVDDALYDFALRHWLKPPSDAVAIVAIDARSIEALGNWPWSRRLHAQLLDRLREAGAGVVALDIVFDRPQADDPGADESLRQAIAQHGRVVLPVFPEASESDGAGGADGRLRAVLPLPELRKAAAGIGHTEIELDADGIARRLYLRGGIGTTRWDALARTMLLVDAAGASATADPALPSRPDADSPAGPAGGWTREAEWWIPYARASDGAPRFQQHSYVDVLRDPQAARALAGRYVLVGATASGVAAGYATPVSGHGQATAGVEIQAAAIDGLTHGTRLHPVGWPTRLALIALLVALPAASWTFLSARAGLATLAAWVPAAVALSAVLLYATDGWFGPAPSLAAMLAGYPLLTWRRLERTASSLDQEQQQSRATLLALAEAVVVTDRDGRVTFTNPVARRLCGTPLDAPPAAMDGEISTLFRLATPSDAERLRTLVRRCVDTGAAEVLDGTLPILDPEGRRRELRISASPVQGASVRARGVVIAGSDVTDTVALSADIAHRATHDALTGLPNRTLLSERLDHALAAARRAGTLVAVVFVDLDDFKRVNDGFGHATGDLLLRQVADRLAGSGRATDTVARWGGDEFVLVAEDLPSADAAAALAMKIGERLRLPFDIDGRPHHVTASFGVSLFPKDGDDAEALVQNADRAMYRAKGEGRSQVQFFSEGIHRRAVERREIESGLRRALARGEFELHMQAQHDGANAEIVGAELLLRWRQPDGRLRTPEDFLVVAEQCELIHDIGDWVLESACDHLASFRAAGVPALPLAVNVSPRQLAGRDFAAGLRSRLGASGIDPSLLRLEVTESALVHDLDRAAATLKAIRELGVSISIDDFGTGYSSFAYLRRFPIDELKIDRSFVHRVGVDPTDTAIAAGVIAIGHSLRCRVVAEGVEEPAQLAFLRDQGCDTFQGYYFSRPVPQSDFIQSMRIGSAARG